MAMIVSALWNSDERKTDDMPFWCFPEDSHDV